MTARKVRVTDLSKDPTDPRRTFWAWPVDARAYQAVRGEDGQPLFQVDGPIDARRPEDPQGPPVILGPTPPPENEPPEPRPAADLRAERQAELTAMSAKEVKAMAEEYEIPRDNKATAIASILDYEFGEAVG